MKTYECSTVEDPEEREEPQRISSVRMAGNWAYHAFKRSHDGKATILFTLQGFTLRYGKRRIRYKHRFPYGDSTSGLYWHPDSRRIAYYALTKTGRSLVVLDIRKCTMDQDGGKPPHKVLYEPELGHTVYGMEWSPSGKALYAVENFRGEDRAFYSRIVRIELGSKKVTQVVRMSGLISFFMPPVSRFESGRGASSRPYLIVFGHVRGLFITDPEGKKVRLVSQLPAVGLHNVEWNPNPRKSQLALFFRRATIGPGGQKFQGVYLVHLDRIGRKSKGKYMEQLYKGRDIHTLFYSRSGKYLCWAGLDTIYIRKPDAPAETTIKIQAVEDDLELEIKGMSWHDSEKKIAFTAGNHVFVYWLDRPVEPEVNSLKVATFGKDTTHFTAEPVWVEDEVFVTVFQDLTHDKSVTGRRMDLAPREENDKKKTPRTKGSKKP